LRIASLSACSALAVAAGCGGATPGAIPAGTADALARQSDLVAATLERGDRCDADRLADELVQASSAARVPSGYRAPLLAAARSLAADVTCPPPPPPPAAEPAPKPEPKGHEKPKKHEHKRKERK
jgi:hypothetical protein